MIRLAAATRHAATCARRTAAGRCAHVASLVAAPPDDAPILRPALPPPPVLQPPLPTVPVFWEPVLAEPATPAVDPLPEAPVRPFAARASGASCKSDMAACGHSESCD
jgi:hypothetical protein